MVQARITKSSLSAAWKILILGPVKIFYKFESGHPELNETVVRKICDFWANKSLYLRNGARESLCYC